MFNILITTIFLYAIVNNEAAKILGVFPTPSISHQVVFRPVMHELAKRGHEVTVITPNPIFPKENENIKEIDVHNVSYTIWNRFANVNKGKDSELRTQIISILELFNEVFAAQVQSAAIQKFISEKNQKFDLIFVESCVVSSIAYAYLYNAPVIEFSSFAGIFETYDRIGAASHSLFYPIAIRQNFYNLTWWKKLSELYTYSSVEYSFIQLKESENKMLKKVFGPNIPDLKELQQNIQMVFLNVHPIWDFNRPVPPNAIYLGGLHQNPIMELPKDLQSYLDSSKHGVIYLSFGTNVEPSLLPTEKIQVFINVFSRLPYDILWKWDKNILPGKSENIRISKWFPQSDLLRHPKIKLFITQGGLQSTDEALTAGVPLIAVPMLGDQWFNAEQYIVHGIGVKLDIQTLTEEFLNEAIETVIGKKSYRENVVKLHNIMRDQQQSPLERAIWWTEHVLRHGGATHMRAAAVGLHWTEYYMLDLALIIITLITTILAITTVIIRLVFLKCKQIKFSNKKLD